MITWALENSIETADSMKSRGYGLQGRTSFSNYRFDGRDAFAVIYMLALIGAIITGAYFGFLDIRYFPSVKAAGLNPFCIAYLLLCLFPVIIDVTEEIKWKYLISKI
jgi:energy-coupling factor transport system permease protein